MNRITLLAATVAASAALALSAGTASAGVTPKVALAAVYNNNAEAGQYVQSTGDIHFRDVRATFTITPAQEGLNFGGTNTSVQGGVGVQLCNNSTGEAIQFGLIPDAVTAGQFDIAFQAGTLVVPKGVHGTTHDACATAGLLTTAPEVFGITPGYNLASYNFANVGETVSLEIYYNPASGWASLGISDPMQGGTEEYHFDAGKFLFFTEPGAGVKDNGAPDLSAPADIPLVTFNGLRATTYAGRHAAFSHWTTVSDNFNTGGSATDAPADLLQAGPLDPTGTIFTILSGNPAS